MPDRDARARALLACAAPYSHLGDLDAVAAVLAEGAKVAEFSAELKGSIGEGPSHSNFSDRSSVRILGIERKPRKTTSSEVARDQKYKTGPQEKREKENKLHWGSEAYDALAPIQKRLYLPSKDAIKIQ